jgi:diaminopimelate epimerase
VSRAFIVSGGGNDFLALVEPERDPDITEIAAWCARGLSIGADGVFALRRLGAGRAGMRHWNPDGQVAALCINGTRCAARLALDHGWGEGGQVVVETGAGPLCARAAGSTAIALELPAPAALPRRVEIDLPSGRIEGWFVTVGVPHFVVVWGSSLAACPVAALGPSLRRHEAFGDAGANVDFVRFPSQHRAEVRSFERGVEAETLACGTGVLATAAVGLQLSLARLPLVALTRGGFELEVEGATVDSAPSRWTLAGDARILGELNLGPEAALAAPPPPVWSD